MSGVPFRSGFAAILGRPNAGKSTLVNALVGAKVSIVSAKPQTTRDRIRGIVSHEGYQLVLIDTPGIIEPRDRLNEALMESVRESLAGTDVALHLMDSGEPAALTPAELAVVQRLPCPRLIVPTKIDARRGFDAAEWASGAGLGAHEGLFPVSAVTGEGLDALLAACVDRLPEGAALFDPDDLTDRDLRFLAAEAIREKVFEMTGQELPYATAVRVEEWRDGEGGKTYIGATVYIERESQKGMIIGQGGRMIREIGAAARRDIEEISGDSVFLDLRVKVRKNWRRRDADLKMFGYQPPRAGGRPK